MRARDTGDESESCYCESRKMRYLWITIVIIHVWEGILEIAEIVSMVPRVR